LKQWPVLLVVAVSLGLTVTAFLYVQHASRERLAGRFEREASNLTLAMVQRTESYLDVLFSLRDLFDAEGPVPRQSFGTFAQGQLARHPGIQALEWVPLVPAADRERLEAEARRDGLAGFRLVERDAAGRLHPVGPRPVYYPVFYVEPYRGNERALGYAPVIPARDEAIATARDTGKPVATGRFQAVQSTQAGVAVFVPVYGTATVPTTVAERRAQLRGLIEGFFLIEDMLMPPIEAARSSGIAVTLTDTSGPPDKQLLVSAQPSGSPAVTVSDPAFRRNVPFDMGGRQWELSFALTDPEALESFGGPEWWVLLGGVLATGLLGGYMFNALNQRFQIEQTVVERTRALRKEKELARKYLDVAGVIMVMVDSEGVVCLINRQGGEILGYAQDEIVGMNWFDTFVPERERESVRQRFATIMQDAHVPHFFECPVITRSGDERLIAWHSTGLTDEDGRPATLSSGADVTDYRRAIEEVAARQAELNQAKEIDKLKNTFTSSVSHDLRTPLTSIVGYAEFLEDQIGGPLTPDQQGYVTQIMRGAKRLEHLVDDLLDFARIDAGTFHLRREPIDFLYKIHEAAESFKPQLDEAGLTLEVEAPPGDLTASLDASRIERVLFNLLHNAIKFTPSGGVIRLRAWAADGMLHCEVEDTGVGIAEHQIPLLFQRFSQLQGGSEKGGTGLGLSICQAIVDAHHGDIGVRSRPGEGSVFWFSLPLSA
jgi:PAS domain S-box-containing protein